MSSTDLLPSTRSFFQGIIDYAGLFPPAQLPLSDAIRNYATYSARSDGWMLGRFLCPVSLLSELPSFFSLFKEKGPLSIGALLSSPEELQTLSPFIKTHRASVCVDAFELRLSSSSHELRDSILFVEKMLQDLFLHTLTPFFEISTWRQLETTVEALAFLNHTERRGSSPAGLKIRCGGAQADLFPSSEQILTVIKACKRARIPFKCTAGLHHPFRHFDKNLKVHHHGFMNIFAATLLHNHTAATEKELLGFLALETPEGILFDNQGFQWDSHRVDADTIALSRKKEVLSFGSCSFDEPTHDLRTLGWIR